jgi:hypothetical protein
VLSGYGITVDGEQRDVGPDDTFRRCHGYSCTPIAARPLRILLIFGKPQPR